MRLTSDTLTGRLILGLAASPKAVVGAILCVVFLFAAIVGPYLVPQNPYDLMTLNILDAKLEPGSVGFEGATYWLGSDGQGRDMLSAMVFGLRTSLGVGLVSGIVAMLIGTVLGLIAAYVGGRTDTLIMRLVDLMLGFPTILVALMLLALLGQGMWKVILALILVQWARFARAVRGAALVERNKDYIEAAETLGLSTPRILLGHLLPNCLPPLIVIGTLQVAHAISAEATPVLPRHRPADHRTVARSPHRQRLRRADVRRVLDERLSRPGADEPGLRHQSGRRPAARGVEPAPRREVRP